MAPVTEGVPLIVTLGKRNLNCSAEIVHVEELHIAMSRCLFIDSRGPTGMEQARPRLDKNIGGAMI